MEQEEKTDFSENYSQDKNNNENKKEFIIKKSDGFYNLIIMKEPDKDYIFFRCYKEDDLQSNYEIKLKFEELANLNEKFKTCKSNEEMYNLLLDNCEKNQIKIRETIRNEIITLLIKSENIEINLMNTKMNKDYIINKLCKSYNSFIIEIYNLQEENEQLKLNNSIFMNNFNELIKDVEFIKNENNKLKNEIEGLKSLNRRNNVENDNYFTDPNKLQFGHYLTDDSYSCNVNDNTFVIFKTLENYIYLVYATEAKTIQCQNVNTKKIIQILLDPHNNHYITNLRYNFDKKNNRELLLSASKEINNIKIWDIKNWNCIVDLKNIYNSGNIRSACILNDENCNYIVVSNDDEFNLIKIYDFNSIKIKEFPKSEDISYFIDTYYDKKNSNYYVLSGNRNSVKSFNFKENKLYKKYYEQNSKSGHYSIVINIYDEITKLIESDTDGFIRIWDFHLSTLLNKIIVSKDTRLNGICLWNEKYLFVGSNDNSISLIDLSNIYEIKKLKAHQEKVCCIQKIIHPQYGECLISQGYKKDQIRIWIYKN